MTCQLEPLEGLEAASLPRLIHIQVVAGEAGEYDIVYSLPKEGRYIFTNFTWDQICVMLDINHSSVIAQEVNSVHFSDTRCGSEFMAVTFKIVLSWSDFACKPLLNSPVLRPPGDLPAWRGGAARGEVLLGFFAQAKDFSGTAGIKGKFSFWKYHPPL